MDDLKKTDILDGDKVIEEQTSKRKEIIQIVFLIVIILCLGGLVSAIITVHKYKDMLSNPVGYNLERFNIPYCQYVDSEGRLNTIYPTGPDSQKLNTGETK